MADKSFCSIVHKPMYGVICYYRVNLEMMYFKYEGSSTGVNTEMMKIMDKITPMVVLPKMMTNNMINGLSNLSS